MRNDAFLENKYLHIVLIVSFVSLSFSLFSLEDYHVTGAIFFISVICLFLLKEISIYKLCTCLIFMMYVLFLAAFNFNDLDVFEYLKTFLQFLLFIFVGILSFGKRYLTIDQVSKFLISVTIVILFFEMLQVVEQMIFNSYQSWFYFDAFSISTAVDVGRFESASLQGYMRPVSIYHEPGYLAFALLLVFVLNDNLVKNRIVFYAAFLGIIFSMSSLMQMFLLLYLILTRFGRSYYLLPLGAIAFVILVYFSYDFFRFDEVFRVGTSGYERVTVPVNLLSEKLRSNFFGVPLGNLEIVLNTSFFLIFFYFGFIAFPIVIFFSLFVRYIVHGKTYVSYMLLLVALTFMNGALFTLEGTFFLFLINMLLSYSDKREKYAEDCNSC